MTKGNKEKKEKMVHILAAFIILVHAYEKYDLKESSYIFFLIAGILFLTIALFHHRLVRKFPYADGFFFLIEAMFYAVIAADYFHLGKKGLPWFYILAAVGYVIAAIIQGKRGKARHAKVVEISKAEKSDQ